MSGELGAIAIAISIGALLIFWGLIEVSKALERIAKAMEEEVFEIPEDERES